MRRLVIDGHCAMQLGDEARSKGYLPGCLVDVIVTSADTLIIRLVDEPVLIERTPMALPASGRRRALNRRSER